jgi:FkbM family methyltransferase
LATCSQDWSKSLADGAKVWAFEPNRENFRCARITLLINGISNIELFNAGLGRASGNATLVTSRAGKSLGGLSLIASDRVDTEKFGTEIVEILVLDAILERERPVSVIHLDVENYEQNVLAGAMETINRWRPILILEGEPDRDWMAANVLSLGYARRAPVDDNVVFSVEAL